MNMKFLVTGSSGQLAGSFISRFQRMDIPCVAPPEGELDITDPSCVENALINESPDVVINCAAYNNVESAETQPAPAYAVNSDGVGNLAEACRSQGRFLIHYGTDYVFDGTAKSAYTEDDTTAPLNEYGKSKLAGEEALRSSGCDHLLLRVSWVYGNGEQNFLHKMQTWAEGRTSLQVVTDQVSIPTYCEDIALYTLKALDRGLQGLYHLTNTGFASRYDVATLFFQLCSNAIELLPADSSTFSSPVQRPVFSAMSNARLTEALGEPIPTWQDALGRFVTTRAS